MSRVFVPLINPIQWQRVGIGRHTAERLIPSIGNIGRRYISQSMSNLRQDKYRRMTATKFYSVYTSFDGLILRLCEVTGKAVACLWQTFSTRRNQILRSPATEFKAEFVSLPYAPLAGCQWYVHNIRPSLSRHDFFSSGFLRLPMTMPGG